MSRRVAHRSDAGAAPVEFVLVGVYVTLLFLAVLQLGVDFHVRNVCAAAAAEGARHAANADVADLDAGAQRARELITQAVGGRYARDVTAREMSVGGAPVVEVDVRAPLPLLALWVPRHLLSVHVTGHALREG
jgi:hypothetical protein